MKRLFFLSPLVFVLVFLREYKPSKFPIQEKGLQPHYEYRGAPGPDYIWHYGDWIRHGSTYVYHKGFWIKAPSNHPSCASGNRPFESTVWIRSPRCS